MFTLDSVKDFKEETKTISVKDETYKIRRLDGIDLLRFGDLQSTEERFQFVLANGLLDGKTEKPIGGKVAYRFIRANVETLVEIFNEILRFSNALQEAITDAVEEEKKNSESSADSNFTADVIANDTGSTPER